MKHVAIFFVIVFCVFSSFVQAEGADYSSNNLTNCGEGELLSSLIDDCASKNPSLSTQLGDPKRRLVYKNDELMVWVLNRPSSDSRVSYEIYAGYIAPKSVTLRDALEFANKIEQLLNATLNGNKQMRIMLTTHTAMIRMKNLLVLNLFEQYFNNKDLLYWTHPDLIMKDGMKELEIQLFKQGDVVGDDGTQKLTFAIDAKSSEISKYTLMSNDPAVMHPFFVWGMPKTN
jgi:hypothetical protein